MKTSVSTQFGQSNAYSPKRTFYPLGPMRWTPQFAAPRRGTTFSGLALRVKNALSTLQNSVLLLACIATLMPEEHALAKTGGIGDLSAGFLGRRH